MHCVWSFGGQHEKQATNEAAIMVKLLLCGQVNGQWGVVFERAQKLNAAAKGAPFQLLLCVGGAFPFPSEYLDGSKRVSIPTYFIAGHEDTAAGGDEGWRQDPQQQALFDKLAGAVDADAPVQVAENLFFLGKQGIATVRTLFLSSGGTCWC